MRLILLFFILFDCVYTEQIDKKKVLEIIKAAKQHKSVPIINQPATIEKNVTTSKSFIVYRKKKQPTTYQKRDKKTEITLINGSLPNLTPSSIELRKKFQIETQSEQIKTEFKTPIQKKLTSKKINTIAKKIEF